MKLLHFVSIARTSELHSFPKNMETQNRGVCQTYFCAISCNKKEELESKQ